LLSRKKLFNRFVSFIVFYAGLSLKVTALLCCAATRVAKTTKTGGYMELQIKKKVGLNLFKIRREKHYQINSDYY